MSNADLVIAGNTIWVVVAAVLVMFMQAGFAFLEAGMTRMKNAAHVAGKNILTFALCSLVYWAVGFGLAFGDGNSIIGTHGFFPSVSDLLAIGKAPYSFFTTIPASAGYLFEVVFAGVSVAIVWGGMAERAKLWVYFVFGAIFTVIYSVVSHWIWAGSGWLFGMGMQDFAGSTVVHYQGALAALAGAIILGPRIGRFGPNGEVRQIAGHNMPYAVLGVIILWFGWFGFNPGSTLAVESGDKLGYFAYVATTTNLAAAAGALGGLAVSWIFVHHKPDLTMMLNGVLAALVAITAASGFVAPWAAVIIGFIAGGRRGVRDQPGGARAHRRSHRRSGRARHGRGVGHACDRPFRGTVDCLEPGHRPGWAVLHRQLPPARRPGGRSACGWRLHVQHLVRHVVGDGQAVGNPGRGACRDRGARPRRARHLGISRVWRCGSQRGSGSGKGSAAGAEGGSRTAACMSG